VLEDQKKRGRQLHFAFEDSGNGRNIERGGDEGSSGMRELGKWEAELSAQCEVAVRPVVAHARWRQHNEMRHDNQPVYMRCKWEERRQCTRGSGAA
jgi:hypothetical protein